MSERIGIVWNPTKIDEAVLRDAVGAAFSEDDDVQWWETSADDPGRSMAEAAVAAGCDVVIAVGGDGTVRVVAEVIAQQGERAPTLGIVPQGTGNLLARNLGIPLGSVPKALTTIAAGRTREIDMGWVRADDAEAETGFLVMIGSGLDAHMLAETDDDLKDKAGWLAYVEAMGRALTAAETSWLSCGYAAAASVTLSLTVSIFWETAGHPGPNVPDGLGDAARAWACCAIPPSASGTATRAAAVAFAVRMPVNLMATLFPWRREHC